MHRKNDREQEKKHTYEYPIINLMYSKGVQKVAYGIEPIKMSSVESTFALCTEPIQKVSRKGIKFTHAFKIINAVDFRTRLREIRTVSITISSALTFGTVKHGKR